MDKNITIHLHSKKISANLFNMLIGFIENASLIEEQKIEIITDYKPLLMTGSFKNLSHIGKQYFKEWHKHDTIRNIRSLADMKG